MRDSFVFADTVLKSCDAGNSGTVCVCDVWNPFLNQSLFCGSHLLGLLTNSFVVFQSVLTVRIRDD